MNPENTARLLNAYPLLYRNLRDQTFECNDGWFDLVDQVSADIESGAQLEGTPKTVEAWPSVDSISAACEAGRLENLPAESRLDEVRRSPRDHR